MSAVDFARLFLGNQQAYGDESARAVHCTPKQWMTAVQHHYSGQGQSIGVYPMMGQVVQNAVQWLVRWGCVDFDIKSEHHAKWDYETEAEAHTAATNLWKVLQAFGITAWVERTRSHGRHVWVFSESWVTAGTMRNALFAASEIAGTAVREVNPKSDGSNLSDDQLGNFVRLPYAGDEAGENGVPFERVVYVTPLDEQAFLSQSDFVTNATASRTSEVTLDRVAALYVPPLPEFVWPSEAIDDYTGDVPRVVRHVIENGPNDGDRSKGMLYIAHECKKAGLSPEAAYSLVSIADDAWGKYTGRRDRELRLREVVERGYR